MSPSPADVKRRDRAAALSNQSAELGLGAEDIATRAGLQRDEVRAVLNGGRSTAQARSAVRGVLFDATLAARATGWQ